MVWAAWCDSLAAGGTGVPRVTHPKGAPPPGWAGLSAAYQPQGSMTQSCLISCPAGLLRPAPPWTPLPSPPFLGGTSLPWGHGGLSGGPAAHAGPPVAMPPPCALWPVSWQQGLSQKQDSGLESPPWGSRPRAHLPTEVRSAWGKLSVHPSLCWPQRPHLRREKAGQMSLGKGSGVPGGLCHQVDLEPSPSPAIYRL